MRKTRAKIGQKFWFCQVEGKKFKYSMYVVKSIRTGRDAFGIKRKYASIVEVVPKVTVQGGKFVKRIPKKYFHSVVLDDEKYIRWELTSFRTTKKQALRLERTRVENAISFWSGIAKDYLAKGFSFGEGDLEIRPDELPKIKGYITRKKKLVDSINVELRK